MTSPHLTPADQPHAVRPPYRPPIGVPVERVRTWRDAAVSVVVHALLILLVLMPALLPTIIERGPESAGGPGPAGGGGGGTGGTGGDVRERLHYIQIAPAPAPPKPAVQPVTPPVTPPVVPPVVKPPVQKTTSSIVPNVDIKVDASKLGVDVASITNGSGGGSGNDGSGGNGPGSGGGVGAGVGTGRGNATGPGTGGGNGTIYTPVPIELFIPPMPVPERIKGSELVAVFDVDSTGRVISFDFKPTRDGGYNRRLREVLGSMRWRPATTLAGVPVRAQGTLTYSF